MTGRPYLLPPVNEVCEVVFLHLSVSHSVHGEGGMHTGGSTSRRSASREVCIQGDWADASPIGYYGIKSTSGQYASYWNAFLLRMDSW